jgi:V8-like Glu-specific endopeptidase
MTQRKTVLALASGAAVIMLAAAPGYAANAAPVAHSNTAPTVSHSGNVSSGPLVPVYNPATRTSMMLRPAQAAQAIRAFWTPQRMAAATPEPLLRVGEATMQTPAIPTGPQQSHPPVLPQAARMAGAIGTRAIAMGPASVPFTSAEGVAFFVDPADGQWHYCSASTMNSANRSLVLTAGHCVHDGGGGGWMENWIYEPGYENGAGSLGSFPALSFGTETGWVNNADEHYDYGFAHVGTNFAGQHVTDAVGGNGFITNPGRPSVTLIGYPSNVAGGQLQAFCIGGTSRRSITDSDQEIGCNWSHGASGSPWIENYNTSFAGLGWVISDTTYFLGSPPPIYGPYYDGAFSSLFSFMGG